MHTLKILNPLVLIFLFNCSNSGGIGIVNEPVNLIATEYSVYSNRKQDVVMELLPGDTLYVIKWGYGKDYVYFKVKCKKKRGYVFLHDPITFIGTKYNQKK